MATANNNCCRSASSLSLSRTYTSMASKERKKEMALESNARERRLSRDKNG